MTPDEMREMDRLNWESERQDVAQEKAALRQTRAELDQLRSEGYSHESAREEAILRGIRAEVAQMRNDGHSRAYICERSLDIHRAVEGRVLEADQQNPQAHRGHDNEYDR
jgi:hypothetical protein